MTCHNFKTFALLILFLTLASIVSGESSVIPHQLQDIRNQNFQSISSNLNDLKGEELPIALALVESLKFDALHIDLQLKNAEIESLKKLILQKIELSEFISLQPSESFPVEIPQKTVVLDGSRILIQHGIELIKILSSPILAPLMKPVFYSQMSGLNLHPTN